jgi:hypothetical protein
MDLATAQHVAQVRDAVQDAVFGKKLKELQTMHSLHNMHRRGKSISGRDRYIGDRVSRLYSLARGPADPADLLCDAVHTSQPSVATTFLAAQHRAQHVHSRFCGATG